MKDTIVQYIKNEYGVSGEQPWEKYPENIVFRHKSNQKWFALIMPVAANKLGMDSDKILYVMNVKLEPDMVAHIVTGKGIFPAYHMNKIHWVSIALDGSVAEETVISLLDLSYEMTK